MKGTGCARQGERTLLYMELKNNTSNLLKGVLCMCASGLGFAFMNLFVRLSGDMPTFQKTIFRNMVILLVSFIVFMRHYEPVYLSKRGKTMLMTRSLLGTLGIFCNFYAVDRLPISDASVLNKLSPFFAILFSYLILKEKAAPVQLGAVATALCGAVLIANPSFNDPRFLAYSVAILGGLSAGISYTCLRWMTLHGVNKHFIIFFFSTVSVVIMLPFAIATWKPVSIGQVLLLFCAGLGALLGQYGITFAYSFAPAKQISIYDYSQVIFSGLLSAVFLGELPRRLSLAGYAIVFCASLMLFIYNNRTQAAAIKAAGAESDKKA